MDSSITRVDYDRVAAEYDQRYAARSHDGVRAALQSLIGKKQVGCVVEVGCGTGHWLRELAPLIKTGIGIDPSVPMLLRAKANGVTAQMICGVAEHLPLVSRMADVVFCVHVLHHLRQPAAYLAEAMRILKPGGTFATIGLDPHDSEARWYLYEYFEGVLESDQARYLPREGIADLLRAARLQNVAAREVETVSSSWTGQKVFDDPFLKKSSACQLLLLSDDQYRAGLQRMRDAISEAETKQAELVFHTTQKIFMVSGDVAR